MNKLFFSALLFASSTFAFAESFPTLVVKMKSGAEQSYTINEAIRISTPDDSLRISSEHISVAYPLSSVSQYYFQRDEFIEDGIEKVLLSSSSEKLTFKREGDNLIIMGLPTNSKLRVFSTNSTEYFPQIVYSDDLSATIKFSTLPQGTYIIVPTGVKSLPSLKFLKQ